MATGALFDWAERRTADTSADAFEAIRPSLNRRELVVFLALHDYLNETFREDVTGGELTAWMVKKKRANDVNDVRPRLTGLKDKGWILELPARPSRVRERPAHPYVPVLPRHAAQAALEKETA